MRRVALAALLLILSGCTSEAPTQARTSLTGFCKSVVEGELAGSGSRADRIRALTLLERAARVAPADIKKDATALVADVRRVFMEGATGVFSSPAFERREERIDGYVASKCKYPEASLVAKEYAFEGVPETLKAGTTTFKLKNEGSEVHELAVFRIDPATKESFEDLLELSQAEAAQKLQALNSDMAAPGGVNREIFVLTSGRYGLACFIPTGTTKLQPAEPSGGDPHIEKGMFAELEVR